MQQLPQQQTSNLAVTVAAGAHCSGIISHFRAAMSLRRFVLSASVFWRLSSAMSVTSNECAVIGCGVLGTSLCRQLLESPEFADWKGT